MRLMMSSLIEYLKKHYKLVILVILLLVIVCPKLTRDQVGGGPTIFGSSNTEIENIHREISDTVNKSFMSTKTNCSQTFTGAQTMDLTCALPPAYMEAVHKSYKLCTDNAKDSYGLCLQYDGDNCDITKQKADAACEDAKTEQTTCRFSDIKQKMTASFVQGCEMDNESVSKLKASIEGDLNNSINNQDDGLSKAFNTAMEKLGDTTFGGSTSSSVRDEKEFINRVSNTFTNEVINDLSQDLAQSQTMKLKAESGATFTGISQDVSISAVSEFLSKNKSYNETMSALDKSIDNSKTSAQKGIFSTTEVGLQEFSPARMGIAGAVCCCLVVLVCCGAIAGLAYMGTRGKSETK